MLLAGTKVVEVGVWVAGPAVGGVLADWGADVVKVEPPTGDPMRNAFRAIAGIDIPSSPPFNVDNRGKKSVVLDLRSDDGRALMLGLLDDADVFLTNLRPDALKRLGLDWDTLAARNERLVYAHVTGYGLVGPDKDRAGYDIGSFWARAGIAHLLAPAGEEPVASRGGFGDHITAMTTVAGVAAALLHRERTGKGQLVDNCLLRSAIWTLGWDIQQQIELGIVMSAGKRTESIAPTVSSFCGGDGRWIWLLGVEADRHWPRLARALDRADLIDDERFADSASRRTNGRELMAILDAEFAKRPIDEWTERFDREDLWWAPVQTPAEVVEDPQAIAAGAFTEIPRPGSGDERQTVVASPVRFSNASTEPRGGVPDLGADTDDVLTGLGLGGDEIAALRARGVLG